jgi:hypothetical protein
MDGQLLRIRQPLNKPARLLALVRINHGYCNPSRPWPAATENHPKEKRKADREHKRKEQPRLISAQQQQVFAG